MGKGIPAGAGNEGKEHREREAKSAAKRYVKDSPEADGPHVLADAAVSMHDGIVPSDPAVHHGTPDLRFLQGRIALTKPEVALAMGCTEYAVEQMQKRGEIPSVKLGRSYYFPVRAVERHLEALAYATSGALDQWEQALADATANRLRTARRRAYERRKAIQSRLKRARENRKRLIEREGIDSDSDAVEEAKQVIGQLWAAHEELDVEQQMVTEEGEKLRTDILSIMEEFGLDASDFDELEK